MNPRIFMVWHTHEVVAEADESNCEGEILGGDSILLGIFSTREGAGACVGRMGAVPEISGRPGEFMIVESVMDRGEWPEGFVTVWT